MSSINGQSVHYEEFNEKDEELSPISRAPSPLPAPLLANPPTGLGVSAANNSVLSAPPTLPVPPQIHVAPGTHVNYTYTSKQSLGSDLPAGAEAPGATSGEFQFTSERKKIILCFDGTGNKFKGNAGDTNILKIFRMLDRTGGNQFHYYQPGIGTYITNGTLSRVHVASRIKSWCEKAMDAAVGTSFDQHVIGGYKFLMRYYSPGDDIYMFGFSRGAYTARFLAEMLDHVGLVSQGNEEMVLFAWKTFSNWQQRQENSKKEEMYNYMRAFRETFARPVRRVRFMGLFDTVNSVPRFEQAWLKRSRGFPYTAKSTARVIRHAVGIDERRAKFRQDLIEKTTPDEVARRRSFKHHKEKAKNKLSILSPKSRNTSGQNNTGRNNVYQSRDGNYSRQETLSHNNSRLSVVSTGGGSIMSFEIKGDSDEDEDSEQDIEEVWFPGAHGDIGGGWDLPSDEAPLSHGPLVWMVREAMAAGVVFDKDRMKEMHCWFDEFDDPTAYTVTSPSLASRHNSSISIPAIEVSGASPRSPSPQSTSSRSRRRPSPVRQESSDAAIASKRFLLDSYAYGKIHDCLLFRNGLAHTAVLGWKVMEYLPFRRMDLQPDGSWKPISWPLPCGEVRDIPEGVRVHSSVIRRMEVDENYRPGNLIVGGGGRGVRIAPPEYGIGDWVCVKGKSSLVGELYMKRSAYEKEREQQRAWKRKVELKNEEKNMQNPH